MKKLNEEIEKTQMFIGKKSFNSKLKTKIFISYIIMLLFTINIKIIERQLIIFKLMNEQEINITFEMFI